MSIKKKIAMITGVGGFIGSHLADKLLDLGYIVYGTDVRDVEDINNLNETRKHHSFNFFKGDIRDKIFIDDFFVKEADIIFHLAAVVGVRKYMEDPISLIDTTIIGTRHILEQCVSNGVRVLFASTSEVYGKNKDVPWDEDSDRVLGNAGVDRWCYSTSKALVEHMLFALQRSKKLNFSTVRFFNVYGPRQSPIYVVSQTLHRLLNNESPDVYDGGKQIRCFTYINDAIDGMISAATSEEAIGHAFNIGTEKKTTIGELIDICRSHINDEIELNRIDTKLKYGSVYQDIDIRVPDSSKAKRILNWTAKTELDEGIKKTIKWVENNRWYLS